MHKQKQHMSSHGMKTHTTQESSGVVHHYVTVHDPYASPRHAVGRLSVRAYTGFLEWYLQNRPHIPFDHRKNLARKLSYIPKGMRAWAGYMPGGFATYYASEPYHKVMENGARLDIITRNFFKHTYDAVGLRSRSAVLAALVVEYTTTHENKPVRWLSIAGGAGQHILNTLRGLPEATRSAIDWTLIDNDLQICNFAHELYNTSGPHVGSAEFVYGDIFDSSVQKRVGQLKPNIVDIIGLFDYLDDARAAELMKIIYEQVAVGAIIVLSNMNDNRPHLHVHQRAVGWPGVIPRSAKQMTEILKKSGINPVNITTYCPQDRVYTVYRVEKT